MRTILAAFLSMLLLGALPAPAAAQDATGAAPDRSATGGAQTLEDILARQRGEKVDNDFRRNATSDGQIPGAPAPQLAPLGGLSDSEIWRDLRFNEADVSASARGPAAGVLVQDGGMRWLQLRDGPLRVYGGYLLLGMIAVIALFYLIRGRIRIDGEKTGRTILRFNSVERFAHWTLAGSFILLGITGLVSLFGRVALIPLFGKEAFSTLALASKWVHNNVAWAFMLGLVLVIVLWVIENIPNRHDLKWLAVGGGLFSKGVHPPAKKFNAGQKLIFWAVVILGVSISASGLSLLFPFELPMFAATFETLNALGIPQAIGLGELNTALAPHEEMQLAQLWHAIIAFIFMAIIIAHIYLGSLGMEGAYDAMGSGEVEVQWAKEHHRLWYDEVTAGSEDAPQAGRTPAE
ncbi:formate dehydrogenase subunit gamma [Maritimibacter sp. 55A14]|uniref:formate dehydrogenase subunit gamma n=1 Tax=Maritimibacter sp. 55A14 TaxID=2174844 RepID=UPI000D607C62|nr:formate dehydrogenase subunit gamma [Maritimibacter sp. 55A14]PWE32570.1 formate dehydrogenase subunit gamma [Maritimibacter sp. 55A14]